ncbi:hypothetical protein [Streptomyces sp. NPDC047079]|uniref:hypothetical protein n=1 Tax=Streptomyces sp. NPDC047079 TaxID=3154607 RepID=UPI003405FC93
MEACGYVPVALSGQDYIELLPAAWRAVNSYGIRINNRTYDAPELGPMRRRDSGITADEAAPHEPAEDEETMADVIPLGLFDPFEDPWKRS